MILVVTLLLLALVLVFVGYPLARPFVPEPVEPTPGPALGQRERLLAEREHALSTLQELEFERGIGNLSEEDYAALQGPHRRKAVAILSELDAMGDDVGPAWSPAAVDEPALDARLESEIARARARLAGGDGRGGAPVVQEASPLCPLCRTPHAATARFCVECGHRLREDGEDGEDGIERTGAVRGTHEG